MSRQNVEAFKRATEATNRRDVEAVLVELDPAVEFHSALDELLGGKGVVYRGYSGIREFFRDFDEALDDVHYDYPEVRDLGDRVLAIGRVRARGRVSGAEIESPVGVVVDFRNGKATRLRSFLDPHGALEAAGLRE